MFIITCNSLRKLNDYLVNRPGRFHYHFRFDYPDSKAIREYLSDKGIIESEIQKVVGFSSKVKLNYDCLRSIAFELESGETFEDIISDLNIINQNDEEYTITLFFNDGAKVKRTLNLDLFNDEDVSYCFYHPKDDYFCLGRVTFNPSVGTYNPDFNGYTITPAQGCRWEIDTDVKREYDEELIAEREMAAEWRNKTLEFVLIKHHYDRNIHYMV
jgi:hypothetical protein